MNAWGMVIIAMMLFSLGIEAEAHGRPKTGTRNFWIALVGALINAFIFYKAGLFQ